MSMVCFERADALHAHEKALRAIQVTDADSLCAYLKGFWEFIYNHKMFGCVYDIYADGIELARENGFTLHGIPAVERDIMTLCAAFPNLQVNIADIFAVPNGENAYRVWMRYYFTGTNTAYSIYGAPTGLRMEGEKALNMSAFYVENIDGEWLIVSEKTVHPCDYIRAVCTGDKSFTSLEM
ncbi:MAG TPA: ester cyclase [Candidatus Flavonifractor intestinipullorum]|uniref:Ester cyclase n=1 Tax=Candidatus Flavonifractor intestinipullorum TaxID=2838587 RepID=A0A9D2M9L8_9FIRM|nr:ester cyclase [Candidatus Flavonifractor intestinipullorum]